MNWKNITKLCFRITLILILGSNHLLCQKDSQSYNSKSDSIKVSPTKALIMSGVVPGSGQIYARSPIKAGIAIGAEAFCIYKIHQYDKIDGYVDRTISQVGEDQWDKMEIQTQRDTVKAVTGYDLGNLNPWEPEENLKKTIWWLAGVHILNMLDAYVEAHLINFPENNIELTSNLTRNSMKINLSIKL